MEIIFMEPVLAEGQDSVERTAQPRCEATGEHRSVLAELGAIHIQRLRSMGRARRYHPVLRHEQRAADTVHDKRRQGEVPLRRRAGAV